MADQPKHLKGSHLSLATKLAGVATATMFALSFLIGWLFRRHMAEATIAGLSGAYGNIGYMGPGSRSRRSGPPRTCRWR